MALILPSCIPGAVAYFAPPMPLISPSSRCRLAALVITMMVSCQWLCAEERVLVGDKWIQGAIKKPGALRKQLGVKEGETIPPEKLRKVKSRLKKKAEGDKKLTKKERTLQRRVQLAQTLNRLG